MILGDTQVVFSNVARRDTCLEDLAELRKLFYKSNSLPLTSFFEK